MWYVVATIILYAVAFVFWLIAGASLSFDYSVNARAWKVWRASFVIGLVTIWAWGIFAPCAIMWCLARWTKDAWDLFREREKK